MRLEPDFSQKLFNPVFGDIDWKKTSTKKKYTAASIAIGICTLGVAHAVYGGIQAGKHIAKKIKSSDSPLKATISADKKIDVHLDTNIASPKFRIKTTNSAFNEVIENKFIKLTGKSPIDKIGQQVNINFRGNITGDDPIAFIDSNEKNELFIGINSQYLGEIPEFRLNGEKLERGSRVVFESDKPYKITLGEKTILEFHNPPQADVK